MRQADADRADLGVGDQLAGVPVTADALGLEGRQQVRNGVGDGHQACRTRSWAGPRPRDLADLADVSISPDGVRRRERSVPTGRPVQLGATATRAVSRLATARLA